jgi:hypothetical protein
VQEDMLDYMKVYYEGMKAEINREDNLAQDEEEPKLD